MPPPRRHLRVIIIRKDEPLQLRQMYHPGTILLHPRRREDLMRDKGRPDGYPDQIACLHRRLEADDARFLFTEEAEGVLVVVVDDGSASTWFSASGV